jgi:phosphopantetheinyl transferase
MPLILKEKKDKFSYSVWKTDEDLSFFLNKLSFFPSEKDEMSKFKSQRLLEWISARYLLSLLEKNVSRSCVLKDKYGKPYLENSNSYISISHSGKYITAIISEFEIGIDIQVITNKISKIKNKFLSKSELLYCNNNIDCLTLMWTAKEAVYKAYGKKKLDFIENIKINNFMHDKKIFRYSGILSKQEINRTYELNSMFVEDAILTIAVK